MVDRASDSRRMDARKHIPREGLAAASPGGQPLAFATITIRISAISLLACAVYLLCRDMVDLDQPDASRAIFSAYDGRVKTSDEIGVDGRLGIRRRGKP